MDTSQRIGHHALIIGIIGLFIWPMSPIAIHFAQLSKQSCIEDPKATAGYLLGWMGILLLCLAAVCYGGILVCLHIWTADAI